MIFKNIKYVNDELDKKFPQGDSKSSQKVTSSYKSIFKGDDNTLEEEYEDSSHGGLNITDEYIHISDGSLNVLEILKYTNINLNKMIYKY